MDEPSPAREPSVETARATHTRLHEDLDYFNQEFIRRPDLQGSPLRERVLKLRGSIGYRALSVMWHLEAVHSRRTADLERLNSDLGANLQAITDLTPTLLFRGQTDFFLLDDIVFSTLSLFDYLGGLIAAVHQLPEARYAADKRKWADIVNACRAFSPTHFDFGVLGGVIRAHAPWVSVLESYRGDVIHREARVGRGHLSVDLDAPNLERKWKVTVPVELEPALCGLVEVGSGERIDVVDGASALVVRAFNGAAEILHILGDTMAPTP